MSIRKDEYKPLLFTTTIRNPERIKDFLKVISKYDGQILSNKVIKKIAFDLIKNKIYLPEYVNRIPKLKSKAKNDESFTDEEVEEILENSPQEHKEAGFDKGWPSRFDTWYKFLKELGFIYYEPGRSILLSNSGKELIKSTEPGKEYLEQEVYLSAFSKYQRDNPYRRVKNRNKPLVLLLQTILKLREIYGNNSAGISVNEIPLFICWRDDNYIKLADTIVQIRKKYRFTPSDEYIYSICKDLLGIDSNGEKRFKISNICHELPDEFIRKMRMTGLLSLRGMGRFVDINNQSIDRVNYVISNYSSLLNFSSEKAYFDYAKSIDYKLVNINLANQVNDYKAHQLFTKLVENFDLDTLLEELNIVGNDKRASNNPVFKLISKPLRFEFLTALTLQKQFKDILVEPNYSIDDEGMPVSFAPGGKPDIVCTDKNGKVCFEVSLIMSRQVTDEMIPIQRHLEDVLQNDDKAFTVFLDSYIHPDAKNYVEWLADKKFIYIIPIEIKTFTSKIKEMVDIRDFFPADVTRQVYKVTVN